MWASSYGRIGDAVMRRLRRRFDNVVDRDHNGFTHQDPGFIDHVMTKKAEVVASTCRRQASIAAVADDAGRVETGGVSDDRAST